MRSIGTVLRTTREGQSRPVDEIARELRIRQCSVSALEADDVVAFPGAVFYRSFVRQYAALLGLSRGEFDAELKAVVDHPETYLGEPRALAVNTVERLPGRWRRALTFLRRGLLASSHERVAKDE